ncbi:MAG: pitrilysin family protein [Nitrospirota bacterium]
MYKKELLDNGIRVVTESIPHVRSVSLGIWLNVGSRDEEKPESGISHFIEHMLFKGTDKRSAKDIAIEMDSMGGELNAFTSKEGTTYYVKVLDEHLPRAFDLLSDIFNNSVFDPKEIDRERKVIIEEIKMVEDTPDDLVHEMLYESVWKGNPLGQPVLGTKKSIKSLGRKDLTGYMDRNYLPSGTVISVAGKFHFDSLMETLNKSFGGRKKRGVKKERPSDDFKSAVNVRNRKLEQAHICIGTKGLPYTHEDRFGMYALNTLIGSSMSSRLFQEIREKRGLAYSVYSYLTSLRDTGLFVIYAGVSPGKAAQVVRLIVKEILKIKKSGISADELGKVKEQLKGNMVLAMENTYNRMSQLAKQEMYLGRHFTLDELIADIEKVDLGQMKRLVNHLFDDGNLALTALGPIEKEDLQKEISSL